MIWRGFFFALIVFASQLSSAASTNLERAFFSGLKNPHYELSDEKLEGIGQELRAIDFKLNLNTKTPPRRRRNDSRLGLIAELFRDGHLQEGIWFLDQFGYYAEAQKFSSKLETWLTEHPPVLTDKISSGVTGASWGLSGNLPVVVKPADKNWEQSLDAEIYAYQLDRILGFGMVPAVILTKVDWKPRSMHLGLKNVTATDINHRDNGYLNFAPELFILDFLLENTDRHSKNSLKSPLGFLVAIDHGRLQLTKTKKDNNQMWTDKPSYPYAQAPSVSVIQTIAQMDINNFREEFGRLAPLPVVEAVAGKLAVLKSFFLRTQPQDVLYGSRARPVLAKDRLIWSYEARRMTEKRKYELKKTNLIFVKDLNTRAKKLADDAEVSFKVRLRTTRLDDNDVIDLIKTLTSPVVEQNHARGTLLALKLSLQAFDDRIISVEKVLTFMKAALWDVLGNDPDVINEIIEILKHSTHAREIFETNLINEFSSTHMSNYMGTVLGGYQKIYTEMYGVSLRDFHRGILEKEWALLVAVHHRTKEYDRSLGDLIRLMSGADRADLWWHSLNLTLNGLERHFLTLQQASELVADFIVKFTEASPDPEIVKNQLKTLIESNETFHQVWSEGVPAESESFLTLAEVNRLVSIYHLINGGSHAPDEKTIEFEKLRKQLNGKIFRNYSDQVFVTKMVSAMDSLLKQYPTDTLLIAIGTLGEALDSRRVSAGVAAGGLLTLAGRFDSDRLQDRKMEFKTLFWKYPNLLRSIENDLPAKIFKGDGVGRMDGFKLYLNLRQILDLVVDERKSWLSIVDAGLTNIPFNHPENKTIEPTIQQLVNLASIPDENRFGKMLSVVTEVIEQKLQERKISTNVVTRFIQEYLDRNGYLTEFKNQSWLNYFIQKKHLGTLFKDVISLLAIENPRYQKICEDVLIEGEELEPENFLRLVTRGAINVVLAEPLAQNDYHPAQRIFAVFEEAAKFSSKRPELRMSADERAGVVAEAVLETISSKQEGSLTSQASDIDVERLLERTLFNTLIFLTDASPNGVEGAEKVLFPMLESNKKLRQNWLSGLEWRIQDPLWKGHHDDLAASLLHWEGRRGVRCQRSLQP